MIYAPVLIITLNRCEHLKRCIESLRKNPLAKETDLYIGLDYPPNERYEEGFKKVSEYLDQGIEGFREVIVVKQTVNQGMFGNFTALEEKAYERHDRIIYSEDDNEFSENYLEYMNRCLEQYEEDDSVLAVSGYNYPIDTSSFTGNVFRCGTYFAAWGYGIWKKKEAEMRKDLNIDFFSRCYRDSRYMRKLSKASRNQYANMIKGMLGYTPNLILRGRIREVDLAFGLYMAACGKFMIFPVESKVRNWGYDGSGENCTEVTQEGTTLTHRNFQFDTQEMDIKERFPQISEEYAITQEQINHLLDDYFVISTKEYIRTRCAYFLSRIVGIKAVGKIVGSAK